MRRIRAAVADEAIPDKGVAIRQTHPLDGDIAMVDLGSEGAPRPQRRRRGQLRRQTIR